jgi:hypothetical protein
MESSVIYTYNATMGLDQKATLYRRSVVDVGNESSDEDEPDKELQR